MCLNVLLSQFSNIDKWRENSIKQCYFKRCAVILISSSRILWGLVRFAKSGPCPDLLNENLWGGAQKSAFNKPSRRFGCPPQWKLHGYKELPCIHRPLQQLSTHGSSCSICMPPLPICCLLCYFGANLDTLSFHPWMMLCLSLRNKDSFRKNYFKS